MTATEFTTTASPHLFERALGDDWSLLPAVTRNMHKPSPVLIAEGCADIHGAETRVGRIMAKRFRFPPSGAQIPLRVTITRNSDCETWERAYPARTMRSVLSAADPDLQTIEERFGPFRFRLRLVASAVGIDLVPQAAFLYSMPMPTALLPQVIATERVGNDDRHLFDVMVSLRGIGRLVHYRGWLKIIPQQN